MRDQVFIHTFCVLMALAGLGAVAWAILSGQVAEQGLDALFLVVVGLLAALLFALIPVQALRRRGWPRRKPSGGEQGAHA